MVNGQLSPDSALIQDQLLGQAKITWAVKTFISLDIVDAVEVDEVCFNLIGIIENPEVWLGQSDYFPVLASTRSRAMDTT